MIHPNQTWTLLIQAKCLILRGLMKRSQREKRNLKAKPKKKLTRMPHSFPRRRKLAVPGVLAPNALLQGE
jgi:hypothetical protein